MYWITCYGEITRKKRNYKGEKKLGGKKIKSKIIDGLIMWFIMSQEAYMSLSPVKLKGKWLETTQLALVKPSNFDVITIASFLAWYWGISVTYFFILIFQKATFEVGKPS